MLPVDLILAMYNRGIRFKTVTHSAHYGAELQKQIGQYSAWTRERGRVISGGAAHTAQLEPGDIITLVAGGATGPLRGHVATVVEHTGDRIACVAGSGRIEEVRREQPPAGYRWSVIASRETAFQRHAQIEKSARAAAHDRRSQLAVQRALGITAEIARLQAEVLGNEAAAAGESAAMKAMKADDGPPVSRDDRRFVPGTHAPVYPRNSWVVEVIKASALTAVEPIDPMVEKGPRLVEQCPDAPPEVVNRPAR